MNNLNIILSMYFQKVSSHNILCGDFDYRRFPEKEFDALALGTLRHLTESETKGLYRYLQNSLGQGSGENGLNVFRALKELVKDYLLVRENEPICRYEKLLEWRELVGFIGEDLSICAFLAYRTEKGQPAWQEFAWDTVIGHDNLQLNRIMQKGISDNHFHLFGSAPAFKLIWLKLMNDLTDSRYAAALREIDAKRRKTRLHYSAEYQEDSLERMHFQAALIRVYLFLNIYQMQSGAENDWKGAPREDDVREMLSEDAPVWLYKEKVQGYIEALRILNLTDYANTKQAANKIEGEFWGERELMYHMLCGKVAGETIPDIMKNWFYAYLVIQIRLREELVQVNENIGFVNFSIYNRRKSAFLSDMPDTRRMVQHAVVGSLESGNMRSLELRIIPAPTALENRKMISCYDAFIREYYFPRESPCNFYYVFHFPKKEDKLPEEKSGLLPECRHAAFRRRLEETARQLIKFRELEPESAARVLGIDACSNEIGCRPEVFGPVFRWLTQHVVKQSLWAEVMQWKMTYHVGEDWLDFADGLRAVDEAILFLNMRNGDRLGHATVLGLDVQKWYERKGNSICLPLQDYLDNVVWMYHKLIEYDIRESENLKGFLRSEYEKYFRILYSPYMDKECVWYDIDTYYEAWKLRGDHPDLYQTGKYENPYRYFREHWANEQLTDGSEIRVRKETALLVYYYHFSADIRHKGDQRMVFQVSDLYIEGVKNLQRAMQNQVAALGISIEANPSSNLLISAMQNYGEHPITRMFNLGLTVDAEKLEECPQLHVSVNTDDKGVFYTSLENEYALMSCALEREGYRKQMVYQWLDDVREHGNQQSFMHRLPE